MQHWLIAALCCWFGEVNAHMSGTDSGAARVNTPPAPLSVPLTVAAPPLCKPAISGSCYATIIDFVLNSFICSHLTLITSSWYVMTLIWMNIKAR